MPNYVKNNITVIGTNEKIYECLDFCKSDDSEFDFNKIVPMPEELNIDEDESSKNDIAIKSYLFTLDDKEAKRVHDILRRVPDLLYGNLDQALENKSYASPDNSDEYIELGKRLVDNCSKYGCTTWYEWHYNNWGTKWNAMDAEVGSALGSECDIYFNTAWSAPVPIFSALSKKFPDLIFSISYADEDIGSNCGYMNFANGIQESEKIFEYGDDSVKFACDVWGYDPEEYLEDEENYEEE